MGLQRIMLVFLIVEEDIMGNPVLMKEGSWSSPNAQNALKNASNAQTKTSALHARKVTIYKQNQKLPMANVQQRQMKNLILKSMQTLTLKGIIKQMKTLDHIIMLQKIFKMPYQEHMNQVLSTLVQLSILF
ncbi:UNKNOWN [Stylonychia lemnae]|uniref:Uncharacterized protein n=1 Tax=Stylonychia lemnae TaxID=5949 RepID=A0A078A394_STYLE|nr:UNKNOWN [Stylonychia lemnae]|eukprot:CDW76287.1 UNKNOWN [Stylonychia lemnae]